ncbi:MAG: hypothetical protein ACNYWU_03665 [Desulfobacterales bacterium]
MKKLIVCFCLMAFFGGNGFLCAQEIAEGEELYQTITNETLHPYLEALKNGDVNSIKQHISEDMYKRYKVLLEENKDYPEFLRNCYRGVDFWVEKIERIDHDISASVIIKFPENESSRFKFLLRKKMDNVYPYGISGRWKIVKQLSE